MFKTQGVLITYVIACKNKAGYWFEERIEACSPEMARQIIIGRFAPVRISVAHQ